MLKPSKRSVAVVTVVVAAGALLAWKLSPTSPALQGTALARGEHAPSRGPSIVERVRAMSAGVAVNPELAPVLRSEAVVGEIDRAVITPWRDAWLARSATRFSQVLAPEATMPAWGSADRTPRRDVAGIAELAWTPGVAAAPDELSRYLGGYSRIDHVQLDVVHVATPSADRASASVRFDVRGMATDGGRRQDRGVLAADFVKLPVGWRVLAMRPTGALETLVAPADRRPAFEDATAASGLVHVAPIDRREAVRRGGYALAVTDYDSDGRPDVLVGNWGPVQLFHNTRAGFVEVTREVGLRGETLVKSAAFADLDDDGHPDLVMSRFVDSTTTSSTGGVQDLWEGAAGDGDFIAYRNLGNGRFERKGNVLTRHRHYDRSMPIAIADLDGDGHLDVYIGFPGARDFTNDLARTGGRGDLAHQGIWLNRGDWNFTEGAPLQGEGGAAVDESRVFPHAVIATDLTGDARPELVVVDDSGRLNPVYRNEGNGIFHDATREMGFDLPVWGMGATAGDFDGDGANDVLLTSVAFASGERMMARLAEGSLSEGLRHDTQDLLSRGMHLYRNDGDGRFADVTDHAGLSWAGSALGCAEWVDYDNDGRLDLYVANGLWTGGPEDADTFFVSIALDRATRASRIADLGMSLPGATGTAANPILSILREFRGTLADPARGSVSEQPTLSLGGRQRNRLFRNNGDGTFTDVAWLENADRIEDGYVVAAADIDGDGRQDLVLRNADPAPSHSYPAVVYLRNTGTPQESVEVSLEGVASNRAGIGARVIATVDGRAMSREVHSVNGASQGTPVAHFGLAGGRDVASFEVRWPSGLAERFAGAPAGRSTLREGTGVPVALSVP